MIAWSSCADPAKMRTCPSSIGRRERRGDSGGSADGTDRDGGRRVRGATRRDRIRCRAVSPATLRRAALVVDDDAAGRAHTGELLRRAGFEAVDCAGDGSEALERLDASRYGLVLCDLRMPGMDGVELMRHLADRRFDAPIVLTSASDERLLASATGHGRTHGLNVAGGLRKPLNRVSLHRMLVAAGVLSPPPAPSGAAGIDADALRRGLDDADAPGRIRAWFRPVLRVRDGATIGAEAVPHWSHPESGEVGAEALASAVERTGLGGRLTMRLLDDALALRRTLPGAARFAVSVALSGDDLNDFGAVERLHGRLEASGLPEDAAVLSVSECRLVEDAATATEVLTRLRMRGFELSIDDFGTGWSSLALLAQIPFGRMRIDARFVLSAPTDPTATGIVESSVHLARRLGMSVVADGIESQAHWDLCARHGIDAAQGYLLGRPTPPEAFAERYLRT